MNYIWGGMLIIGIVFGVFTGNTKELTDSVLDCAKEAVTLGISMLGIVSFWSGLMQVAEDSGIINRMAAKLMPVLRLLFPKIPEGHAALNSISANFIANIFGLGWAATPAGLQAMKDLELLECSRESPGYGYEGPNPYDKYSNKKNPASKNAETKNMRHASNEMCTFLVMNISSLQLIPVNIIAYRSQYGSVNPAAIIAPSIICTLINSLLAFFYCRLKNKRTTG